MLEVEGGEEPGEEARAIVRFPNILRRVLQSSIANEKVRSSACEVQRVDAGKAADREFSRDGVEGPMPAAPA